MRKMSLALALSVAAIAAPALAGPIGSGLWLTEQVAKQNPAAKPAVISIAHADVSCLVAVAPTVAGHSAVHTAEVKKGKLAVRFHTQSDRAAETEAVHAMVAKACSGAQLASA